MTPLLLAVLVSVHIASADCTPTASGHERWATKTRSVTDTFHGARLSVDDMLAWPAPHVDGWKSAPETTVYQGEERRVTVSPAYVFLVKFAADDCDIHVEVAATRSVTAPRIIGEAPPTDPDLQLEILDALGLRTLKPGAVRRFAADTAPVLALSGFAFLDLSHQVDLVNKQTGRPRTQAALRKGHAHGSALVASLWEVHPIIAVKPLAEGGTR